MPSSDGVELELHHFGGSGPALLICHATGFLGRVYEAMGAELTSHFDVFAMDFRAHGDSTAPSNGRLDWRAMAEDVVAVTDAIAEAVAHSEAHSEAHSRAARPVLGFGHSMGGAALLLAEREHPGLLGGAYLFEPIVIPDDHPLEASGHLAGAARRRRRSFDSRADALYRYASRPPLANLKAGVLASYVEHGFWELADGTVELKCAPESEAAVFEAEGKPTFSMLKEVRTSALVAVGGANEGWSPAVLAPHVASAMPNARMEIHPQLGHFGPLEAPKTVAASVLQAFSGEPR